MIVSLIGISVFMLFIYAAWNAAPDMEKDFERQGYDDAMRMYDFTYVIPRCPSAEELMEQNYSVAFIKNYLKGFRNAIEELSKRKAEDDYDD